MSPIDQQNTEQDKNNFPPAGTGNASNPSPRNEDMTPESNQLIDKKGEKYLREVASIEDMPDAEDQQDMDKTFEEQKED